MARDAHVLAHRRVVAEQLQFGRPQYVAHRPCRLDVIARKAPPFGHRQPVGDIIGIRAEFEGVALVATAHGEEAVVIWEDFSAARALVAYDRDVMPLELGFAKTSGVLIG